jgi:hypothetical protein
MPEQTTIERAFELARSGKFLLIDDLKRQLGREGFNRNQILGPHSTASCAMQWPKHGWFRSKATFRTITLQNSFGG